MNTHAKGLLITTLGVLCIVPDSLFVKLIVADPLVTAFWRGLTSGIMILLGVLAWQGLRGFREVVSSGWPAWIYIVLMGSTAPTFVLAISLTSVANVVFIFASIPIFASLFGKIFLGEPIGRRMVFTMMAVTVGLAIIAYGSGESEVASWKGDLIAVYIAVAYAGALTAVRKAKHVSLIPAIPIGYIGVALLIWPFVEPMAPVADQWPVLALHGGFIAMATLLLTLGPRYISSAEVALLILLESILAPLLVWAVVGEDPGRWVIAGGTIVIGALVVSNTIVLLRNRERSL